MELKDYTTEELKAEISRRYAIRKAERNSVKRCRQCVNFGVITYFGKEIKDDCSEEQYIQVVNSIKPKMGNTIKLMPHLNLIMNTLN